MRARIRMEKRCGAFTVVETEDADSDCRRPGIWKDEKRPTIRSGGV